MLRKLFKWSSKSAPKKTRRRLPTRQLAPVEDIAEQGLLVANVAARMNVKNAIIMNALRRDIDYNPQAVQLMVQEELTGLATERAKDATHIRRVRDEIRKYGRSAWQETEYGNDDSRTLKHRQEVYELLSQELKNEAEDEAFLAQMAKEALAQAWEEIGVSLMDRAAHPYYSGGASEEYQRDRGKRIQELIDGELKELKKLKKKSG